MSDIDIRYADWRATGDGAAVVGYVRDRALRLRERGFRHYGISALVETARYDHALEVGPDARGLKIDNNHRAFIARELMASEPMLEGFFEVRRSKADGREAVSMGGIPYRSLPRIPSVDRMAAETVEQVAASVTTASFGEAALPLVAPTVLGLPPVTPDDVPVGDRWSCATCGHEVTMESHPTLQPALGGHKQGQCPNAQCWSNKRGGKARGHAIFTIVRRSHP